MTLDEMSEIAAPLGFSVSDGPVFLDGVKRIVVRHSDTGRVWDILALPVEDRARFIANLHALDRHRKTLEKTETPVQSDGNGLCDGAIA